MAGVEHARDLVFGEPDAEIVAARRQAGWRMVAIEWERDTPADSISQDSGFEEAPYGYRVAPDCRHIEPEPAENEVLATVMQMIVQEQRLPVIAAALNDRGFRTRAGAPWNPAAVFDLMPRLIDSGPRIFSAPDWSVKRRAASAITPAAG